jgi:hypothetical protein
MKKTAVGFIAFVACLVNALVGFTGDYPASGIKASKLDQRTLAEDPTDVGCTGGGKNGNGTGPGRIG